MRELAIKINKAIGEDGHIRQASFTEWTPYNVAVFHPFVDGNKRTAFILIAVKRWMSTGLNMGCLCGENFDSVEEHYVAHAVIPMNKEWLRILKEC